MAEKYLYVCRLVSGEFSAMVTKSLKFAGLKRGRRNKMAWLTSTARCLFSSSPFCSYYWSNEMNGKDSGPRSFATVFSALLPGQGFHLPLWSFTQSCQNQSITNSLGKLPSTHAEFNGCSLQSSFRGKSLHLYYSMWAVKQDRVFRVFLWLEEVNI